MKNFSSFYSKNMIGLLIIIFCSGSFMATAQVNNITNPGASPYATIQAAINNTATVAGDVLQLTANVFEGLVIVNKAVVIDGNGYTLTSTSGTWGVNPTVPNITILNLTIQSAGTFGINTGCGANNLVMTNVTVQNCGGTGMGLHGSDNAVLTNFTALNNGGNGLSITDCDNTTINGITTSGNTFGSFSAGVGLFTSGTFCPPAGINGFSLTGAISIAEPTKVYSQKTSPVDVITGLSGASISWAVGIGLLDRSYWPDKATAYTVVDALFEPPYNFPNTAVYVAEVATENFYVDDNPNGDATPPMLIQTAINFEVPGKIIFVEAGTYNENVTVNKSITLRGTNANVACGSRGTESIIAPASGVPVTVTASGVTINGFEITAPSANYAINGSNTSNLSIIFNNIHDIGTTVSSGNVHSVIYQVANATATSNVSITDNCFNNISSSLLSGWSASAIGILQSPSTGVLTGLNIERNTINNVNVNTGNWAVGKIAYGIILNTGSANYMTTTGKVVNAVIRNNEISNLSGHISTGIALEGNTENAVVENNIVSYLNGTKTADRAGGGYDLNGLKFESNRFVSTVTVENNSFMTNTFTHSAGAGKGYGVVNYVPVANGGTAVVECNWFGTNVYSAIVDDGVSIDGKILNKTSCATSFVPYLSSGVDASATIIGFQPSVPCVSCTGTGSLSVSFSPSTRYSLFGALVYTGCITLTPVITGGVGPFTYSWTSSDGSFVNPGDVPSITPCKTTEGTFTYTVVVTPANGCPSVSATVTVTYININCSSNANNIKVKVCHVQQGNPTNCNTICVSVNAYQALLNSGSYLGNCLPNCEVPATRGVADISNYIVGNQDLKVKVFNNPTENHFRIYVSGDLYEKVSIRVLDVYGRVVEQRQNIKPDQEIRFGDRFVSGSYMVEVVQGTSKKVIQLVKR